MDTSPSQENGKQTQAISIINVTASVNARFSPNTMGGGGVCV